MKRYFSLDLLRGLAVFGMIIFHFFWVLDFLGWAVLDLKHGFWVPFVRVVQFLFLGLVGFSLSLSQRVRPGGFLKKQLPRLVKIAVAALIVSVATYFVVGGIYVRFGVLHFVVLASTLIFPFVGKRWYLIGVICLAMVGVVITRGLDFSFPVIAYVLGFKSVAVPTMDYFPLVPWIIVVLVGALIEDLWGSFLPRLENKVVGITRGGAGKILTFLGRNSLSAYLLHVPLIILILLLYSWGKDVLM